MRRKLNQISRFCWYKNRTELCEPDLKASDINGLKHYENQIIDRKYNIKQKKKHTFPMGSDVPILS